MLRLILASIFLSLSFTLSADSFPKLDESVNSQLQNGLEQALGEMGLKRAIQSKKLSVALVDITDPNAPQAALINGDHMMYAASLPKIAILFGVFSRIENEELNLTPEIREQLTKMIRYSSNTAATDMLNLAGKQYLSELLQSPKFRLYDTDHNGGLWVGKEYGKGKAFKRDPLHHLSHGATALQVARFYYMLETKQLVAEPLQDDMKEILSKPGINHKFVKGLTAHRPGSELYRKSGTWKQWHADSVMVEREGKKYIAVALAESQKGSKWLSDMIVAMDDLVMKPEQTLANREADNALRLAGVSALH